MKTQIPRRESVNRNCSSPGQNTRSARPLVRKAFYAALLTVCAASAPAQRPEYSAQRFPIAGIVVNAVTDEPVRRATVKLLPEQSGPALQAVRTDGEGRFSLAPVAAGKYRLQAARRGYPAALYEQHENFSSAVVAGPDQDTAHLVFHLQPAAILHGVVTDDSGEPVEDASVRLYRKPGVENPGGKIDPVDRTSTSDTGAYEFGNLPAGNYLLAVVASPWYAIHSEPTPGAAPSELDVAYPVTYYDSTTDEASALPIQLDPGNRIQANLSLHAVPAVYVDIHAPGQDSAELRQSIFGNEEPAEAAMQNQRETEKAARFYGLAPGHYAISAGTPPRVMDLDATTSGPADASAGTPTATVTGTVESAPGVPSDGLAILTLAPADGSTGQRELQSIVVKGKFSLENVPDGQWTVKLTNGYGYTMQVNALAVSGKRHAGNRLAVAGQAVEVGISVTEGVTTIRGFARRQDKGFAGAMVVLVPQDLRQYPELARRDQSDSDGSFSLGFVLPGQYTVVAVADAWQMDWAKPETIARYLPGGTAVTVPAGTAGTLRLDEPVAVQPR